MKEYLKSLGGFLFGYARKATFAGLATAAPVALATVRDGVTWTDATLVVGAFVAGFLGTFGLKNVPKGV